MASPPEGRPSYVDALGASQSAQISPYRSFISGLFGTTRKAIDRELGFDPFAIGGSFLENFSASIARGQERAAAGTGGKKYERPDSRVWMYEEGYAGPRVDTASQFTETHINKIFPDATFITNEGDELLNPTYQDIVNSPSGGIIDFNTTLDKLDQRFKDVGISPDDIFVPPGEVYQELPIRSLPPSWEQTKPVAWERNEHIKKILFDNQDKAQILAENPAKYASEEAAERAHEWEGKAYDEQVWGLISQPDEYLYREGTVQPTSTVDADRLIQKLHSNLNDYGVTHRESLAADIVGGFGGRIAGFMATIGASEHYATGPHRSEEGLESLADSFFVLDVASGAAIRGANPALKTLKPYLRAWKSQIADPSPMISRTIADTQATMPHIDLGKLSKSISEVGNPFSDIKSKWRSFRNIIDYNPTINKELINDSTLKFHEVVKNTGATDQEADVLMRFMGNQSMTEYGDPQEIFRKTTVELGASDDSLGIFRTSGTDQYFDIKHIYTPGGNKRYFKIEGGEELLQRAASEDTTILQDKLVISNLQEAFQFEKTQGKTFLSKEHLLGAPNTNDLGLLGEKGSAKAYDSIGLKISQEEIDITGIREYLEEFPDGTRFSLNDLERYAAVNKVHIVKHEAFDHWGEVIPGEMDLRMGMEGFQEEGKVILYAFDFDNTIGERSKFSTDRVAAVLNPFNEERRYTVLNKHYQDIRRSGADESAIGRGGYIPREVGVPVTEGAQPWRADTLIDEDIYMHVRVSTRPFYAVDGSTILKADVIEEIQSDWIQNMTPGNTPNNIYNRMRGYQSEHWFTNDTTDLVSQSGYRYTHITNHLLDKGQGAYRTIDNPSFSHNQSIFTISPINRSGETNLQTQFDLITSSLDEGGFRRNDEIGKILQPTPSEGEVIFTFNDEEIIRAGLNKENIQIGRGNQNPTDIPELMDDIVTKMRVRGTSYLPIRTTPVDNEKAYIAVRIKGGDAAGHKYIEVTTGYKKEYHPDIYGEANINLIGSNDPRSLDPKVDVVTIQRKSNDAFDELIFNKLLGREEVGVERTIRFNNLSSRHKTSGSQWASPLYSRQTVSEGGAGFNFRGNRDGTWAAYDGPLKISPDMDTRDEAVDYIGRMLNQLDPNKPFLPENSFFKNAWTKQGGMLSLQNSANRGRSGLLISTADKIRSRYVQGAPYQSYTHNHQPKPSIQAAANDSINPFDATNKDNRKQGSVMKGLVQGIAGVLRGNGYDVSPGTVNKSELVSVRKVLVPAPDPLGTDSVSYQIVPSNEESHKLLEVLKDFKADDLIKIHAALLPTDLKPQSDLEKAIIDIVDFYYRTQDIEVNPIDALARRDVAVADLIEHFGIPQHLLAKYTDVKPKQALNSLARFIRDFVDPDADPIDLMEEIKLAPADTGGNGVWHHFIDLDVPLESLFGKAKDNNGNVLEHSPKTLGDILRNQPIRQYKTRPELGNTQGKVLGHVDIYNDGTSVITAMESANFGTMVHEVGHIFRRFLSDTELELVGRSVMGDVGWEALPDKRIWTVAGEENFANALEAYITQGRYKKGMDAIFDKFIVWIRNLFRGSKGNPDLKISKTLSDFFDEFIDTSRPTEKYIRDTVPAHHLASALDFYGYDSGTLRGIPIPSGVKRPGDVVPLKVVSEDIDEKSRYAQEQARINGWDTYEEFKLSGFRRNEDVPLHELPVYAKQNSRLFKLDDEAWAEIRLNTKTLNEAEANLPWDQLDMWRRENPDLVDEALELLPDMHSMQTIMNANNIVDSWEQIVKIPGLREIARRFNPSAAARNPLFRALYARFRMREQGEQLTLQTMARLFKLGKSEDIFGGFDDQGRILKGPLKGFNLNDIRSNPLDVKWRSLLNDAQWEWIRTAEDIEKSKLKMLQAEGISIRLLPEEDGGSFRYAGRRSYAWVSEDGEVIDMVNVGPNRPGIPAGFMKERKFETAEEAIAAGYRYYPDDEALQMNVHAAYKRVAEERFKNTLINDIVWTRTTKVSDEITIKRDTATQYYNNVRTLLSQLHRTKRGENIHPSTLRSLKNHFPDIAGDLDTVSRVTLEHLVRAGEAAKGQPISFTPSKQMIEDIFMVVLELETKVEFLQKSGMEVPQSLLKELADARKSKAFKLFARAQAYENFKNGKGFKYTYEKSARSILMAERDGLIDKLITKVGGTSTLGPDGKPTGKKHNGLIHKANKEMRNAQADFKKEESSNFDVARREGRALSIPAFNGRIFTKEQPSSLDGMTGDDVVMLLSKEIIEKQEFSKVLASAQPMSAAYRFFSLGMDASLAMIHLVLLWGESFTKPKLMGEVAKGYVAAFVNPKYKYNLIEQNKELLAKYPDVILSGRQTETTDFIRLMGRGGWSRYKPVKLAGKIFTTPYAPFSRGVESALDAAGIELLKTLDHLGVDAIQIREISDFVNEIRGLSSSGRLGVSKRQRQVEEISTLAARYNRAIVALLLDIFRPEAKLPRIGRPIDPTKSLRPQLARRALLRGSSFLAMMSVAIGYSLGEDIEEIAEHFNPTGPMFMTWNVHGQNIGIGSKLRSLIKLDAEIAMSIYEGRGLTLFDMSMDNPMVRFIRGNFGYYPAQAATILSGATYMGDRVHTLPWIDLKPGQERMTPAESIIATGKHVFPGPLLGPIWGKSVVLEGGGIGERSARGTAEFFGGRGYPEGGYQIIKQFAKDKVGIDYEDMYSFERKILREILAKDLDPLQQQRLQQGDKNALYWAALDSLDQERYQKEEEALEYFNARKGRFRDNPLRELKRSFSKIQDSYGDQRNDLNIQFDMYQDDTEYDADDPGKFILSEWYATYDQAKDSSGLIDHDKLNSIQSKFWEKELPDGTSYMDFFGVIRMETLTTSHPEAYRGKLSRSTVQNYDLAHEARMQFLKDRGNWHVVLDQHGYTEQDLSIWK